MVDETKEEKETPENQPAEEAPEAPGEGTPEVADEEKTSEKIKALEEQVSSLQAQKEHFREKAQRAGEELEGLKKNPPAPSDAELAETVPDWDLRSPTEQTLTKQQKALEGEIKALKGIIIKTTGKLDWEEQFSQLAKNPVFSKLAEKKDEFREFCKDNFPTDVLVKAFLFDEAKDIGAEEEAKRLKRPGLEKKIGGERTPPKTEMTYEEIAELRVKDPRRYAKLIRKGVIK